LLTGNTDDISSRHFRRIHSRKVGDAELVFAKCVYSDRCCLVGLYGGTENAGVENAVVENTGAISYRKLLKQYLCCVYLSLLVYALFPLQMCLCYRRRVAPKEVVLQLLRVGFSPHRSDSLHRFWQNLARMSTPPFHILPKSVHGWGRNFGAFPLLDF